MSFAVPHGPPGTVSPVKRSRQTLSRPTTPHVLRRPASSASMRSPTPLSRNSRPMTPSWNRDVTYSGNIKVSVRVKPSNIEKLWNVDPIRGSISNRETGEFNFDNVYDGTSTNSEIYNNSVKDLVDKVMVGFHATVFAYGMTGSGKTFSMQGSPSNPGIIPLSVYSIFDHISNDSERHYHVKVGYLEIYNEHLNDLLTPGSNSDEIKLRDDSHRGVKALGLKEVAVNTPEQLLSTISQGDALRKTEGTEYNARSSRSHAVVSITIESTPRGSSSGGNVGLKHSSTLYLCDLAGSERAVSQSERRKEGAYINKSLLTLGTVIARLSSASSSSSAASSGHIPYRDSKLTRLLQPALSGKSLVSVLCTIQTAGTTSSYMETVSTLRFAARAKNVVVNVKRNDEVSDQKEMIERLMQQVAAQKLELQQLKAGGGANAPATAKTNNLLSQLAQLEAENKILNERVEHLTRLCDDSRLEEVLGLGIDDGGASDADDDVDRKQSQQIEEYKSYISHLEKLLYQQELSHRTASTSSSTTSSSSTTTPRTEASSVSSTQEMLLIQDLRDELDELRESNTDKDRIIAALKQVNKRKENLASFSTASSSNLNNNSTPYSRYYNFNSINNQSVASSPRSMYSEAGAEDVTITDSRSASPVKTIA